MIALPSQPQPPSTQAPYHTRCGLIGTIYLKASPLPPAPFDSCGLAGCWLAGLQLAYRLAGFLTGLLVGLPADFDWQDTQDWQGAEQK